MDTDENNDFSAVNMITLKKFHPNAPTPTHEVTKDIDLKELFNVVNSKQQSFTHLTANYDNLVSYNDVKNIFLSTREVSPMSVDLDINNNRIYNLSKAPTFDHEVPNKEYVDRKITELDGKKYDKSDVDTHLNEKLDKTISSDLDMQRNKITNLATPQPHENGAAVNVSFFNAELNDSNTNLYTRITDDYKSYVNKSHITSSTAEKDVFRYLMEDVDESSSESNIVVNGIINFVSSPHKINKKAYDITLTTDNKDDFRSRIGFNAYKLPQGEFTLVIEFFVPDKAHISSTSVNVVSSVINIGQQTTKIFNTEGYTKSIVHLHKWQVSPPEYIMIDLHGSISKGNTKKAHLIVYGVQGHVSSADPDVFDTVFVIENGKMVMETDIDMNGKKLLNYPKSKAVIVGNYRKAIGDRKATFTINGETDYHVFGFSLTIKKITLHVTIRDGPIIPENTRISLNISGTSKSQSAFGVYLDNNAILLSYSN